MPKTHDPIDLRARRVMVDAWHMALRAGKLRAAAAKLPASRSRARMTRKIDLFIRRADALRRSAFKLT